MKSSISHKLKNIRQKVVALTIAASAVLSIAGDVSAAPRKQQNKRQQHEFTVVIDAGHGGKDHGAVDNGAREKDINLGIAKKFAELIKKKMKNVKVVMTRDDDTFISLQQRADIANRNKGDIFISLHTNSADKSNPNRKKASGTSVYALGPQKNADNLKVAQRENSVIELESNYHQKYSGFDPSKDESYIIFEMAQKKTLGQSLKFADKAQKELVKTAGRADRGVKQAGFWVLWATSMPAVLVETDFICNPDVAKFLDSDSGQEKIATALFNALKSYIESQKNTLASNDPNAKTEVKLAQAEAKEAYADLETSDAESAISGGTLVAANSTDKGKRKPHIATTNKNSQKSGPRKRRSASSRIISENRDISAEKIILRSESEYLVLQETPKEEIVQPVASNDDDKAKGKKGKKQKKPKEKKSKEKKVKRADATKSGNSSPSGLRTNTRRPNQKTFTAKAPARSSASTSATVNKEPAKSHKTATSTKQSVLQSSQESAKIHNTGAATKRPVLQSSQESAPMTYTILLVSSDKQLSNNDAAFCGLVPTGEFKENGQYKYTYYKSSNRREIEQKLLEVRTVLPEAVIIVRSE